MEKGQGKETDTLQTDNVFARKEYIKRDAAINAVFEAYADGRSAYIALEAIPAADVVPVVRCKDCTNKFDWPWCGMFPDDGYCSAGVRNDGDEE